MPCALLSIIDFLSSYCRPPSSLSLSLSVFLFTRAQWEERQCSGLLRRSVYLRVFPQWLKKRSPVCYYDDVEARCCGCDFFWSKSSKVKITGVDNVVGVGCSLCGVTALVVNRVLFYCIVLIMQSVPLRVLTLSLPMTYSVDKSHLSIIAYWSITLEVNTYFKRTCRPFACISALTLTNPDHCLRDLSLHLKFFNAHPIPPSGNLLFKSTNN